MRSAVAETDFVDFREIADGEDLVAANGDRFGIGILRIGGEDFGVEENLCQRLAPVARSVRGGRMEAAEKHEAQVRPKSHSRECTFSTPASDVYSTEADRIIYK